MLEYLVSLTSNADSATCTNVAVPMAKLILLMEDPVKFAQSYGSIYRWQLRRSEPITVPDGCAPTFLELIKESEEVLKKAIEKNKFVAVPVGYKLVLQLKVSNNWKDWVSLQESSRRYAGYGVFAERDFPVNSIVGCYMGKITGRGIIEGGCDPTEAELDELNICQSNMSLYYRDSEARMVVVEPEGFAALEEGKTETVPLFMGMHFLNNACLSFTKGSKAYQDATKDQNCEILQDGTVSATKKISPGSELLTAYSTDKGKKQKLLRAEESDEDKKPKAKTTGGKGGRKTEVPTRKSLARRKYAGRKLQEMDVEEDNEDFSGRRG